MSFDVFYITKWPTIFVKDQFDAHTKWSKVQRMKLVHGNNLF